MEPEPFDFHTKDTDLTFLFYAFGSILHAGFFFSGACDKQSDSSGLIQYITVTKRNTQ